MQATTRWSPRSVPSHSAANDLAPGVARPDVVALKPGPGAAALVVG